MMTLERAIGLAQKYAKADTEHTYTKVPDFMPHEWVVAAIQTAYEAGRQAIIDGSNVAGFTPEAIERTRAHLSQPQPVAQGEAVALDAPAMVGSTQFGIGVPWSTVIRCAQRRYLHKDDPSLTTEQIAEFRQALIQPTIPTGHMDVEAMTRRFLSWRLPDDFAPDCGISFTPLTNPAWAQPLWPSGTNLFNYDQAKAMFEYVLADSPSAGGV